MEVSGPNVWGKKGIQKQLEVALKFLGLTYSFWCCHVLPTNLRWPFQPPCQATAFKSAHWSFQRGAFHVRYDRHASDQQVINNAWPCILVHGHEGRGTISHRHRRLGRKLSGVSFNDSPGFKERRPALVAGHGWNVVQKAAPIGAKTDWEMETGIQTAMFGHKILQKKRV